MAKSTISLEANMSHKFKTEVSCSHNFIIDQPRSGGGENLGPNPLEIFLSSLAGCFCAIGRIIANQKQLPLRSINAKIEGEIDKDFLLGKTQDGRAGFTKIISHITIDADMSNDEKQQFLEEIEERCPIYDNMMNETVLDTKLV